MVETERMRIYPISADKLREVIDKETDAEMKQAYSEMLQGCLDSPDKYIWYTLWFMELKTPGKEIAGDLCFKGIDEKGTVEIGYGLYEGFKKKGYMTEAVKAMAEWASKQPGVTKVEAEAEESNIASIKVLERCGFVLNGEMGEEGPRFTWHADINMGK